uniref:Zinc finger, AN1-type domain 3 n=1 Tax=Tetraodon nigroviridis TaxID=99883 RepID=H3CGE0_TETNG
MGDTGSEGSKPPSNINAIPPRCPCGFWGSSKTMNLCSKCFADVQKKRPEDDVDDSDGRSPKNSSNCSQTDVYCSDTGGSICQSLSTTGDPRPSFPPRPEELDVLMMICARILPAAANSHVSLQNHNMSPRWSLASPESDVLPKKRARLTEVPEDEESPTAKRRNRRRCHFCRTKLELVQQEMGSCRCGFVFCSLHRLPEQHGCLFDHLGHGRREAVRKVVKLRRRVGRSCQRIGEESS